MGTVKIINRDTLVQERFNAKQPGRAILFRGDQRMNLAAEKPDIRFDRIVERKEGRWVNSAGYHKLWGEIAQIQNKARQNAAQPPSAATLESLLGKLFIDITKRAMEAPDLTGRIATEITDLEMAQTVNLREIYQYRGEFATISGTNDSVPLIEQATGETDTVDLVIRALGWKDSLANMLYNRLHTLQKVNEAVTNADIDMRNSRVVGAIVGATYVASQQQAADTTSGATYDVRMYNTFRKAIKKLMGLKDYRTERLISTPRISILCNPYDTWSIQRVIGGQLQGGGGNGILTTINAQALPIAEIIEYDQGINNGFTWGKKTLSYPGVTAGTCYVCVPQEYFWVLNKRPLTMESGMGSVLQLSTEEYAWYRVQTEFSKVFFGSSYSGTSLGAGYGAIIEVTLPTDS